MKAKNKTRSQTLAHSEKQQRPTTVEVMKNQPNYMAIRYSVCHVEYSWILFIVNSLQQNLPAPRTRDPRKSVLVERESQEFPLPVSQEMCHSPPLINQKCTCPVTGTAGK